MSICPECGEKVAEIDVFCSYCGITLVRPAAAEEDVSLSETIVGTPPGFVFEEPGKAPGSDSAASQPVPPPSPFAVGDTSANWSMRTESVDLPAELFESVQQQGPEVPEEPAPTPPESGGTPESEVAELPISRPKVVPFGSVSAETPAGETIGGPADVEAEPEAAPAPVSEPDAAVPSPLPEPEIPEVLEPEAPESSEPAVPEAFEAPVPEPVAAAEPEVLEIAAPDAFEPDAIEPAELVSAEPSEPEGIAPEPAPVPGEASVPEPPMAESEPAEFLPEPEPAPVPESPFVSETPAEPMPAEQVPALQFDLPLAAAEPTGAPETPETQESPDVDIVPVPIVLADLEREAASASPAQDESRPGADEPASSEPSADAEPVSEAPGEAAAEPEPPSETPEDEAAAAANAFEPVGVDTDFVVEAGSLDSIRTGRRPNFGTDEAAGGPAEEVPESVTPAEEPKPATQENIGIGDTDGRKAAKLKPLDEGTVLNNRYEIVRKIGGGGMGAVYLANDRNLGGIPRAVKEMVQSYIEPEQQEKAIADFQREAMILTGLEHPAIPTIFDYFFDEKEGRFYLVMKYISGGDLAGRLRATPEGRLDEKTVTEWGIQVADVLDYLHRQDPLIVYRDLKPANIMIDGNSGRLMLIDFGIARSINKEEKGVTAVGTMGYAPPELFSGNVEPRSDIYSLGSTMFHLLTGADPQSNPLLIFDFQKNPRPRQINPQLSDQIEQVLMRAVEYNADLRFASAAELRSVLEDHLGNLKSGKVSFGVRAVPSAVGFSEQHVFCGFCGKQIVASDVFCAFCGSQQPIAQQSFGSIPAAAPHQAVAKLHVIVTNDLEGGGFTLEKPENLIGRRDPMSNIFPEVDLSKYDPQTKISRRHARIWRDGSNYLLEDLGSSNGTVLISGANEPSRLLPRQPRPLSNGDKIRVGDTLLQFTLV